MVPVGGLLVDNGGVTLRWLVACYVDDALQGGEEVGGRVNWWIV